MHAHVAMPSDSVRARDPPACLSHWSANKESRTSASYKTRPCGLRKAQATARAAVAEASSRISFVVSPCKNVTQSGPLTCTTARLPSSAHTSPPSGSCAAGACMPRRAAPPSGGTVALEDLASQQRSAAGGGATAGKLACLPAPLRSSRVDRGAARSAIRAAAGNRIADCLGSHSMLQALRVHRRGAPLRLGQTPAIHLPSFLKS